MPAGRQAAIDGVGAASGGKLDGAAMFAGLGGATGRPASLLVSVNYFGTTELLEAFRPLLAAAGESSAVAISSNSATCQPGWRLELAEACLSGDEARARAVADEGDSATAYPATKLAIARWVRRHAPTAGWAGAGIRLNAVAPGLIETPFVAQTRSDPVLGPLIGAFPLPLGRGGTAEEIAALVSFLLGPQASSSADRCSSATAAPTPCCAQRTGRSSGTYLPGNIPNNMTRVLVNRLMVLTLATALGAMGDAFARRNGYSPRPRPGAKPGWRCASRPGCS